MGLDFVSIYGIIPYVGGAQNGLQVMIIYHIHLTENTGFPEDLFRKTKTTSAFEGGRINEIATLWVNNKHTLPYSLFTISCRLLWGICQRYKGS